MTQVRAALDPDEPDYDEARQLGREALPFLSQMVMGGDPMLGSKATYLAGLIGTEGSADVVSQAARSSNPVLRVAAAGATRHLPAREASDVLMGLVIDRDPGVRKVALTSVRPDATQELRTRIAHIGQVGDTPRTRELAAETLARLSQSPPDC